MLPVPGRSLVQAVVAAAVRDVASEGVGIVVGMRRADRSPTSLAGRCSLGAGLVLLDEHPAGIHAEVAFGGNGARWAAGGWDEPTSATRVRSGLARDRTAGARTRLTAGGRARLAAGGRTCLTAGGHSPAGSASLAPGSDHAAGSRTCLTAGSHAPAGLTARSAGTTWGHSLTARITPSRASHRLPAPTGPGTPAGSRAAQVLRTTAGTRGAADRSRRT